MTVWYKQGVRGDLQRQVRRAVGTLHSLHQQKGEDLFITALRDGNHSAGSLHYDGLAFDCRFGSVTRVEALKALLALSPFFEVIDEPDHRHVEWDCK